MKVSELEAACTRVNPLTGEPVEHIYLSLPRDNLPSGETVQLLGKGGGARGRICTVKEEGDGYLVMANFKTADVLKMIRERK